jgi:hypothetical protein
MTPQKSEAISIKNAERKKKKAEQKRTAFNKLPWKFLSLQDDPTDYIPGLPGDPSLKGRDSI